LPTASHDFCDDINASYSLNFRSRGVQQVVLLQNFVQDPHVCRIEELKSLQIIGLSHADI